MKWYYIVLIVCVIIGPFDALYMYIKAQKRKEALKKKQGIGNQKDVREIDHSDDRPSDPHTSDISGNKKQPPSV